MVWCMNQWLEKRQFPLCRSTVVEASVMWGWCCCLLERWARLSTYRKTKLCKGQNPNSLDCFARFSWPDSLISTPNTPSHVPMLQTCASYCLPLLCPDWLSLAWDAFVPSVWWLLYAHSSVVRHHLTPRQNSSSLLLTSFVWLWCHVTFYFISLN